MMKLTDNLKKYNDVQPNKIAYRFLSKGKEIGKYTYKELYNRSLDVATKLQKNEYKGERVLLLYPSSLEFISAFMGCLYAGVIAVPAYLPENNRSILRLKTIISDCKPKAIFTISSSHIDFSKVESLANIPIINTDKIDSNLHKQYQSTIIKEANIAFLQYTSGSTSAPKGVMVTNENITYNLKIIKDSFKLNQQSNIVSWCPIYHDMGLIMGILESLYLGSTTIFMSPSDFIRSPLLWLKTISKYKASFSPAPNFAYDLCIDKRIDKETEKILDLSSWKTALNGAEPVKADTLEKFTQKFSQYGFKHNYHAPSYGMAEATVLISPKQCNQNNFIKSFNKEKIEKYNIAETTIKQKQARKFVSCGNGKMMQKLWIVDPDTSIKCPDGKIGEIWVQDKSVGLGYWNKPKITKEIFNAYEKSTNDGPFLRTGDLGFFYKNQLFISGRCKDLIIIKGKNIYPQDIEEITHNIDKSLRQNCTACFETTKNREEHIVIIQEISGKVDYTDIIDKINKSIIAEYNIAPYDILLIKRTTISKTTSGKIQRQLCKKLYLENKLSVIYSFRDNIKSNYVPATNDLEKKLIKIWSTILKTNKEQKIGINDNFFYLGGNSILVANVISNITQQLNKEISFKEFFQNPTIRGISQKLKNIDKDIYHNINNIKQEKIPLLANQKALYFIEKTQKHPLYNLPFKIEMIGNISFATLLESFKLLIANNKILCLQIIKSDNQLWQQTHNKEPENFIEELNLSNEKNSKIIANELINQDAHKKFDLDKDFLFRAKLIKLADKQYILYLNFHHIIIDGYSISIFLKELSYNYNQLLNHNIITKKNLKTQYEDYAIIQTHPIVTEIIDKKLDFWKRQLLSSSHILNFPSDYPRSQNNNVDSFKIKLSKDLLLFLKQLAQKQDVSLFMLIYSGLYILLRRYSNQNDISIGVPALNRKNKHIENMIGYFVNIIVLRLQGDKDDNILDIINKTKKVALDCFDNQEVPFDKIVNAINPVRNNNVSPLFQVMLAYQNIPEPKLNLDNIISRVEQVNINKAKFDLTFTINDFISKQEKDIELEIEYNSNLYKKETIKQISKHYTNILTYFINGSLQEKVDKINFLSKQEKQKMLIDWNHTRVSYDKNICIHELFSTQAKKNPNNIAVVFAEQKLTYKELDQKSDELAIYLQNFGVKPDDLIAICIDRSLEMIIGILAILKAGGAYVPLDPEYPRERLKYMLEDSNAGIILTKEHLQNFIATITSKNKNIILIDPKYEKEVKNKIKGRKLIKKVQSNNLAYVIYTSGSTGKPKGVMVEHKGIINLSYSLQRNNNIPKNINPINFGWMISYAFDASLQTLISSLLFGNILHVIPKHIYNTNDNMVSYIKKHNIQVIDTTSSYFKSLLPNLHNIQNKLQFMLGGESLKASFIKKILRKNSNYIIPHIFNCYGLTECTVDSSIYKINNKIPFTNSIPIGKPINNTQIYILDKYHHAVPIGVIGEIYIAGDGLARGYLNRPELTNKKFVANPFNLGTKMYKTGDLAKYLPDGNIEYIGRIDNQVKIRGFRIEINEIETIINQDSEIDNNVVVLQGKDEYKKLICFYIEKNKEINIEKLKSSLKEKLPDYMIPIGFTKIDKIPLTPNGKIDRKKLENTNIEISDRKKYVSPKTNIEKILARIWQEVLNIKKIGINDNFFELGGHSINSIQVVSKAIDNNLYFNITDIIKYQTIKEIINANVIKAKEITINDEKISGEALLTPIQYWLFEKQKKIIHQWNQSILFKLKTYLEPSLLKMSFTKLINHHDSFKLRYKYSDNKITQYYIDSDQEINLNLFNISKVKNLSSYLEKKSLSLEQSLDITYGPLIEIGYFYSKTNNYIFIAVHHLIMDGVSWHILLDDLTKLLDNKNANINYKSNSYQNWSKQLQSYSKSIKIKSELPYWLIQKEKSLNIEESKATYYHKDSEIIENTLSKKFTKDLLSKSLQKYNCEINDLLLTALIISYNKWTKHKSLQINLEGHGRENIENNINISKTIGWFTSVFPVILTLDNKDDITQQIKTVKEILRSIPNKGIGFGILKYLSKNKDINNFPESQIMFNYLGEFNINNNYLKISKILTKNFYDKNSILSYNIEINSIVTDQKLLFIYKYNKKLFTKKEILLFSSLYKQSLEKIVQNCITNNDIITHNNIVIPNLDKKKISNKNQIINLKEGSDSKSLFLFPGILGISSCFQPLTQYLDIKHTIYGINSYNIIENSKNYNNIHDLALANSELIKNINNNSNHYYLLGHSFGAIVAYETAIILEKQGYSVSLIICDQTPKWEYNNFKKSCNKKQFYTLFANISSLLQLQNNTIDFDFITNKEKLNSEKEIITMLNKLLIWNNANIYLDKTIEIFNAIRENYKLPYIFDNKLNNEIMIFRAAQGQTTNNCLTWQNHSKQQVKNIEVLGDHFTMLHNPYVKSLAQNLTKYIDTIDNIKNVA